MQNENVNTAASQELYSMKKAAKRYRWLRKCVLVLLLACAVIGALIPESALPTFNFIALAVLLLVLIASLAEIELLISTINSKQ